jgi:hypothetical protein
MASEMQRLASILACDMAGTTVTLPKPTIDRDLHVVADHARAASAGF